MPAQLQLTGFTALVNLIAIATMLYMAWSFCSVIAEVKSYSTIDSHCFALETCQFLRTVGKAW